MLACHVMAYSILFVYLLIAVAAAVSAVVHKLTVAGAFAGAAIAAIIYYSTGLPGLTMLAAFFILGIVTTSLKKEAKQHITSEHGPRTAWQVLANGGLAAFVCLLSWLFPGMSEWSPLLLAAIFSAAAADTVSSETGNAFGKRYYHILNGRPGVRGANGVVSFKGSFFGLLASGIVAIVYGVWYNDFSYTPQIMIAGTIGNFADSCLGLLENSGYLNNNMVNFLNTLVALLTMLVLIRVI